MSAQRRLSEKDLIECRKYFWGQDKDKDGQLSWIEFSKMCQTIGMRLSGNQMNKAFSTADKNNNGFITFAEFCQTYFVNDDCSNIYDDTEPLSEMSKDKLSAIHAFFYDKTQHHYGKVSRITFVRMVKTYGIEISNQELNKAFEIADDDKDGKISYKEFTDHFLKSTIKTGDNITSKELLKLQKGFAAIDDGDGKLSRSEFLAMLKTVGMELDLRQLNNVYRKADKDGDGTVTFEEFSEAYLEGRQGNEKGKKLSLKSLPASKVAEIRKYFSARDKNRDGRLNWGEFQKMIVDVGLKLPERALNKAFDVADHNKDGSISFAEFIQIYSTADDFSEVAIEKRKLTEAEITECCKYFWLSDKDRDGRLSPTEFSQMLALLNVNITGRELNRAFALADLNADGVISFNEFVKAYLNKEKKSLTIEQMKDTFHKVDKNKNGTLSKDEFFVALKALGNQTDSKKQERLLTRVDMNANGRVTFSEFCSFLDIEDL